MIFAEFDLDLFMRYGLPVLLGLISLLGLYVLFVAAITGTRKAFGKQPPMHEQIAKLREELIKSQAEHEAEDKTEIAKLETLIEQRRAENEKIREDIATNGDKRKTEMFAHIDGVRKGLDTKIDQQTEHFNDKITEMPHQLVALLKNTGAIK